MTKISIFYAYDFHSSFDCSWCKLSSDMQFATMLITLRAWESEQTFALSPSNFHLVKQEISPSTENFGVFWLFTSSLHSTHCAHVQILDSLDETSMLSRLVMSLGVEWALQLQQQRVRTPKFAFRLKSPKFSQLRFSFTQCSNSSQPQLWTRIMHRSMLQRKCWCPTRKTIVPTKVSAKRIDWDGRKHKPNFQVELLELSNRFKLTLTSFKEKIEEHSQTEKSWYEV